MSSGQRRGSALDTDPVTAELTAEDAEAAAVEAEVRAEAARARAEQLRQGAPDASDSEPARRRHRMPRSRLHLPSLKTVAASLLIVVICAAGAVAGSLIWQHHVVSTYQQRIAEAATAARDGIEALMALDPKDAEQCVQRVIDRSTGNFRETYQHESETMIKGLEETQVHTTAAINDVAVESVADDKAVVLVAVRTVRTGPDGVDAPPWPWRVRLTLARDGGQYKMSEVDYIG